MKETLVIILCATTMIVIFGIIASQTEKENFMVICEAKGNSGDFCKNSWNFHKD